MHLLSTPTEIDLGLNGKLSPGQYLVEDVNAGQIMADHHGLEVVSLAKCFRVEQRRFDPSLDWNGKKLLIVRPGAYGDLILLTPVLRELKRRWPGLEISLACFPKYGVVMDGLDLCTIAQYPTPTEVLTSHEAWVFMEGVERNPLSQSLHLTDLFAHEIGIKLGDIKASYLIFDDELKDAESKVPFHDGRRIGIQIEPSGACRHYSLMAALVWKLYDAGWTVYLFGEPGTIPVADRSRLINWSAKGLTFRQSAAILSRCDVFLGPDSALIHVAGALGIPAVGLYGPFPWKLRTAYAPTTFAIQGTGSCAPCFHHSRPNSPFPAHGPCAKTGRCEVLASIEPDRVIAKIEQVYANSRAAGQPAPTAPSPV